MMIIGFGCGLGNQMFQYAFFLSMKKHYPETEIKADIKYAFPEEHNGIEIDKVFGLDLRECTLKERKRLSEIPITKSLFSAGLFKLRNITGFHKATFYKQLDYTCFFSEVYNLSANRDKYFLGVWGNEKYFYDLKEELQEQVYVFHLPLNESSQKHKQQILDTESVSIHVRRGDFVQYQNHILGKKYYEKAVEYIETSVRSTVQYFVFTDDIDYAKKIFIDMPNVRYVTGNYEKDSWMDMYLMSICKHNIIANSSFSFWGAYLNKNTDKIVIAPNKSFKNCKNPFACKEWILIDEDGIK